MQPKQKKNWVYVNTSGNGEINFMFVYVLFISYSLVVVRKGTKTFYQTFHELSLKALGIYLQNVCIAILIDLIWLCHTMCLHLSDTRSVVSLYIKTWKANGRTCWYCVLSSCFTLLYILHTFKYNCRKNFFIVYCHYTLIHKNVQQIYQNIYLLVRHDMFRR